MEFSSEISLHYSRWYTLYDEAGALLSQKVLLRRRYWSKLFAMSVSWAGTGISLTWCIKRVCTAIDLYFSACADHLLSASLRLLHSTDDADMWSTVCDGGLTSPHVFFKSKYGCTAAWARPSSSDTFTRSSKVVVGVRCQFDLPTAGKFQAYVAITDAATGHRERAGVEDTYSRFAA